MTGLEIIAAICFVVISTVMTMVVIDIVVNEQSNYLWGRPLDLLSSLAILAAFSMMSHEVDLGFACYIGGFIGILFAIVLLNCESTK